MSLRPTHTPERFSNPIPLSPRDITRSGLCIGCGSCVAQAHSSGPQPLTPSPIFERRGTNAERLPMDTDAQMDLNAYGQLKAVGFSSLAAPGETPRLRVPARFPRLPAMKMTWPQRFSPMPNTRTPA